MVGNMRQIIRRLGRTRSFTLISVLTLGVGIGANTAIFSVVNGVLLKPLPYEEPDRLVGVWHTAPGLGFDEVNQSPALHYTYASDSRTFESVGMYNWWSSTVTGLDRPEEVRAASVTWTVLPTLGIQPALGRNFTPEEDSPDGARAVILSHEYWETRLGADPSILERTLEVNGRPHQVVGVLPEGFRFIGNQRDLIVPLRFDPSEIQMGNFSYMGIARLKPEATLEEANADVERMAPIAVERYPGPLTLSMLEQSRFGGNVRPLTRDVVGDVGSVLWFLLGTVGMILLIACANVANLFLVRAEGRQKEIALRSALGASRGQITAQFLGESLVLGLLGGAVGLVIAFGGIQLLLALGPEALPRLHMIGVDRNVLFFTLAVSIFAGILFGLVPAVKYGGRPMVGALKEGGRGGSSGKETHRARNGLVVVQMALALVLLVSSGLMVRSFQALTRTDPGFDAGADLLTFRVSIPSAEISDPMELAAAHQAILMEIRELPGVESAAMATALPMTGYNSNDPVFFDDFPTPEGQLPPIRRLRRMTPGFLETMGIPLVAGRDITWDEVRDVAPVVILSEDLVREYWPDPAQALGRSVRMWPGTPPLEVIGVVGAVHEDGVGQETVPTAYFTQVVRGGPENELSSWSNLAYVVKSSRVGTPDFMNQVRETVWGFNPNLPVAQVSTVEELVRESMSRTSFTLIMLGIAAGVALVLGLVGIYGVISYIVTQRTREIGVRIALGADEGSVRSMVLRHAGLLAGAGILVGLVAAAGLTQLMGAMLYGVEATDPLTFAVVSGTLLAVALVASYLPARRAAGVDPVEALRFD